MNKFKLAFELAESKLQNYICGAQSGIHFLRQARLCNPSKVLILPRDKREYTDISLMSEVSDAEFYLYSDKQAPQVFIRLPVEYTD